MTRKASDLGHLFCIEVFGRVLVGLPTVAFAKDDEMIPGEVKKYSNYLFSFQGTMG